MIKLLIFDLDGTLADTGQDITNALNYALQPFGVREYSLEETKAMVGSGISKLLESLIPNEAVNTNTPPLPRGGEGGVKSRGEHISAKELVTNRFLDYYDRHLIDNTYAYPHVKETLEKLAGYKKGIISNKREIYSRKVLQSLGVLEYFDLVWGSDSVREKKPSPIPILDMLDRFQVRKDETVMIGDSNFDVEAGKAAGIKVIAVTYGFRSRELLTGADYIINSFDELADVIPQINNY
jgi:phosphoglycolate phosphatase